MGEVIWHAHAQTLAEVDRRAVCAWVEAHGLNPYWVEAVEVDGEVLRATCFVRSEDAAQMIAERREHSRRETVEIPLTSDPPALRR
ncbi:MAG: hypothetical protein ACRDPK_19400 [Carbonactinosporaceae bacterium]